MMRRRFVNLVAENYKTAAYSLHRLDVSKDLFYPSRAEAQAAFAAASAASKAKAQVGGPPTPLPTLPRLPAPCASFPPCKQLFALVSPRSSEGRILCRNTAGHSHLHDADAGSFLTLPSSPECSNLRPIVITAARPNALEEDLYVLHHRGQPLHPVFEVLRFGAKWYRPTVDTEDPGCFKGWHWESLPPPPLPLGGHVITSHAVVDLDSGRAICISDGWGTYCFDIVEREWREAGDWVLPFKGGAQFVPDLSMWLGFHPMHNCYLCAMPDLASAVADHEKVPTAQHVLLPNHPDTVDECYRLIRPNLISLGQARFCIARVFQDGDSSSPVFAVLTGVELFINDDNGTSPQEQGQGQGLHVVRHRSLRYDFIQDRIEWEL